MYDTNYMLRTILTFTRSYYLDRTKTVIFKNPHEQKISWSTLRKASLTCLLLCLLSGIPCHSFCQEPKKTIPDGTEGEVLVVTDTLPAKKKKKSWNTFNLGFTTLRIGVGFLVDYAAYAQDVEGKAQMDSAKISPKAGFKIRDSRISIGGKFNTKRSITWKAGFMYDGDRDEWFIRETGFMIGVPELWGNFFIGRTKEGISLSKVMNGYAGEMIERYMASDPIPILADGVKWLGFLPKPRIFWNIGVFTDWLSEGEGFSTYSSQFAARVGFLPIHTPKTNLHIAFNYQVGRPYKDSIRIRSKPEVSGAPFFIDAGQFHSNQATYVGGEIYYNSGPWMIGTEYYWDKFRSQGKNNPVFTGGELVTSYIFTGEIRPYSTVTGIYGFIPVKKSVFKGGAGTWEAVLRFSQFDLDDGQVHGGTFWRLTPQVNWYLSGNARFELAYGYGILDRFNMKGTTQFFQSRLQLSL